MDNNEIIEQQLAEIDAEVQRVEGILEDAAAINRLNENEDFKRIVVDGYLDDEAKRLFNALIDPTFLKRDNLQNMMDKIGSIRDFKQYISVKMLNAAEAENTLQELKKIRAEVLDGKHLPDNEEE